MDDEIARLRSQIQEERRRREEADARALEEQRKHEERQRRHKEEQRQHEERQRRHKEEQRQLEDLERIAASALPQDLKSFLESCHALYKLIRPVTNLLAATGGSVTRETSVLFPQRILPWNDFAIRQLEVWNQYRHYTSLWTEKVYPASTFFEFLSKDINPIGSEDNLWYHQKLLVESMVKDMFQNINANQQLPNDLRTDGKITFQKQARFRNTEEQSDKKPQRSTLSHSTSAVPINTRADKFCVLRNKDGVRRAVVAIEYKPPHKLNIRQISIGLREGIRPAHDVIDKHEENQSFKFKHLMAAIVTQLFSYMIDKRVRYGYVCTGEAYVFLYIPMRPDRVYFSVNVPSKDYEEDEDNRLERTAVSQIFAFILQALHDDSPPDQAWVDWAKANLERWKVEEIDFLQMLPETEPMSRDTSEYKPRKWPPSPEMRRKMPRRACAGGMAALRRDESSDEDGDQEGVTSPSAYVETRSRAAKARTRPNGSQRGRGAGRGLYDSRKVSIGRRPYCTQECLQGLSQGLALDLECPNVADHGSSHLTVPTFLQMVRQQMAVDRGKDADCCDFGIHGARGVLLKICLTSHGYTVIGKATEPRCLKYLQHEGQVYDRLRSLQGHYVPVCLGTIDLQRPYHYDGIELMHVLLMSWGGQSLAAMTIEPPNLQVLERCAELTREALKAIHNQRVLHCDAELRNILFDVHSQKLMLVDFERSKLCGPVLGALSPNRKRKRRNRDGKEYSFFETELRAADFSLKTAFGLDI